MLTTKMSRELYRELETEDVKKLKEGIKAIMKDGGDLETTLKVLKIGIEEKDALPFTFKMTKKLWKEVEKEMEGE